MVAFKKRVLPLLTVQDSSMYNHVYYLNNTTFIHWNVVMTAPVISLLPVLIAFFVLQRYYVQGLTAGALKG